MGRKMREEGAGDSPTTSRLDSYLTALTRAIGTESAPSPEQLQPPDPQAWVEGCWRWGGRDSR